MKKEYLTYDINPLKFKELGVFESVAEFNKHYEMTMGDLKKYLVGARYEFLHMLKKYMCKVPGLANATYKTVIDQANTKKKVTSKTTVTNLMPLLEKFGIIKMYETKNSRTNLKSANIIVWQKYDTENTKAFIEFLENPSSAKNEVATKTTITEKLNSFVKEGITFTTSFCEVTKSKNLVTQPLPNEVTLNKQSLNNSLNKKELNKKDEKIKTVEQEPKEKETKEQKSVTPVLRDNLSLSSYENEVQDLQNQFPLIGIKWIKSTFTKALEGFKRGSIGNIMGYVFGAAKKFNERLTSEAVENALEGFNLTGNNNSPKKINQQRAIPSYIGTSEKPTNSVEEMERLYKKSKATSHTELAVTTEKPKKMNIDELVANYQASTR
ncbi:hypothetical protein [Kurthia sibirica]|uniref:Uncharacterized protein n=1 Tax=Kurthia sibirica TaxID=202750 RepID=A0A2U3AKE5_9BACL|nr:hypothetical protein [Kurthia sibirica]PWI25002.1 hypothetical protein DEX24_10535 [Kurthia sibirica]GEK33092.1 hypothetical protein KSI01_06250 [Kurthia sibirica]